MPRVVEIKKRKILTYLREDILERLNDMARKMKLPRSVIIEDFIAAGLEELEKGTISYKDLLSKANDYLYLREVEDGGQG